MECRVWDFWSLGFRVWVGFAAEEVSVNSSSRKALNLQCVGFGAGFLALASVGQKRERLYTPDSEQ